MAGALPSMKMFRKNFKMITNANSAEPVNNSTTSATTILKKRKVPNLPQIRVLVDSEDGGSPEKHQNIIDDETVMKIPIDKVREAQNSSMSKHSAVEVVISPTTGFSHRGKGRGSSDEMTI